MTYAQANAIIAKSSYQQADDEGWLAEWETAAEHVRITDYDVMHGIIQAPTDYND